MPGPILHMGATVLCSHGGQAMPTAPSPVRARVRHAGGNHRRAVRGGGMRLCSARGQRSMRDRAMGGGRRARAVAGPAAGHYERRSICAPTGTPLLPVAAQTRALAT